MGIEIKHGGRIRKSFATPSAYSTYDTWEQGQVLTITTASVIQRAKAGDLGVLGLALEYRRSATDDPTKFGMQTGKGSMVLDETEVILSDDAIESGLTYAVNDKLYVNTNGKVSKSGGAGVNTTTHPSIGKVLEVIEQGVEICALFQVQEVKT